MNLNIGKNIRELRLKRSLSQEKLAEYLKVSPQSVSKWERGEGYPDILFLIPLAEFFGVSLDTLMGRNAEIQEQKICQIIARLEHYRHVGDHASKNALAKEAYGAFPYDFRVICWYITALMDTDDVHRVKEEVESLCRYILSECTDDARRYDAITWLVVLYGNCGEYEKATEMVSRLPDLNDCRQFMSCCIYPDGDERDFHAMAAFIDRVMENLLWFSCQIAVQRTDLNNVERIEILERICIAAEAIYPGFDHCVCHSVMADIYLSLYRYHSEEGQVSAALDALELCFKHERVLDQTDDSVVEHNSVLLRGHTFDMRTVWDGCKCNGVYWVFERLSEPRFTFDCYRENVRFYELLNKYRPYAIEDKTKT